LRPPPLPEPEEREGGNFVGRPNVDRKPPAS
jgi:hypothetical protein